MESNNNRMQRQQAAAAALQSQLAARQQRMAAAALEGMRWHGIAKDQATEPKAVQWNAGSQSHAPLHHQQQLLLPPSARDLASHTTSQHCSLAPSVTTTCLGSGGSGPRQLRPVLARREPPIVPHVEPNNDSPAERLLQALSNYTPADTGLRPSSRVPASAVQQQQQQQQSSDWSSSPYYGYDTAESYSTSGHFCQSLPTTSSSGFSNSTAAMLAGAEKPSAATSQRYFQCQQAGSQGESVFEQDPRVQQDHHSLRCQLSVLREQELQQRLLQAQELERKQRIILEQREQELRQLLSAQSTMEQARKLQVGGAYSGLETLERMHAGLPTSSNGHLQTHREQEIQLRILQSGKATHLRWQDQLGGTGEEPEHVIPASECPRQPPRLTDEGSPTPLSSQRFWDRRDCTYEQLGLGLDQRSSTHRHEPQRPSQFEADLNFSSQQQLERLLAIRRQTSLLQQQLERERLGQEELLEEERVPNTTHSSQAGQTSRAEKLLNTSEQRLCQQLSQLERQLCAQLQLTDSLLKSMASSDERNDWRHQQRVGAAYQNQSSDTQVMKISSDMKNSRPGYYQHQSSSENEQSQRQSQQSTQKQKRQNRALKLQRDDEEYFGGRTRRRGAQEDSDSAWADGADEGDSDASYRSPCLACRRRSSSRPCSRARPRVGNRPEPRHRPKSGSREQISPRRRQSELLIASSNQEERMALGKWMIPSGSKRPNDGATLGGSMRNAMEMTPDLTSSKEEDEKDGANTRQLRQRRTDIQGPDGRRNTIEENLSSQLRRQNPPTQKDRSTGEKSPPPGSEAVPHDVTLDSDSGEIGPKQKPESKPTDPARRRSSDKGDQAGQHGEPPEEKRRNSWRQSVDQSEASKQPTEAASRPGEKAQKQSRRPINLDSDDDVEQDSRRIERLKRREARRESRQSAQPAKEDESLQSSEEEKDKPTKRAPRAKVQRTEDEPDSPQANRLFRRQSGVSGGSGGSGGSVGRPTKARGENVDSRFQDDARAGVPDENSESVDPGTSEEIHPADRSVNKTMVSMGATDDKEAQQQDLQLPHSLRSSWHSKHNKAAPDLTYTQDSDLHRGGADTDSDNDDHTSSMQQARRPPDTGNKVQLLDRRQMMQQQQAAAAPEASKPGAATTAARDSDGGGGSKVATLSERKAIINSVSRLPATKGAPTQVKPEDQLSEEDIEACKTRAAKKNEKRRKRRENKAAREVGDAPQEESDEDEDVAPLLEQEENVEKEDDPSDETDVAPVSDGAEREGVEKRKPSVGGDGGAREPRRKSEPPQPVTRPRRPPPEKKPPPKTAAAVAARAPAPRPKPPPQRRRRRSSRSEVAARAVSVPTAKPITCCPPPPQCPCPPPPQCPCPPPLSNRCCVRCGVASCCYPVAGGRAYCCARCYMC